MLQLILADVRERIRRPAFLVTLAITAYLGYLFVPAPDAGYATVRMGGTTGIPNSAFVGAVVCILTNTFLSLIGFYLVRGSLARDERTGVGPMLAATPVSTIALIFSRLISGMVYLMSLTGLMVVMALIMVIVRSSGEPFDLWDLVSPFIFLSLPSLAVTSAFAVLFDSIRVLRGALGNAIWYFFWTALLVVGIESGEFHKGKLQPSSLDLAGSTVLLSSMTEKVLELEPGFTNQYNIGIHIKQDDGELKSFLWEGIDWNSDLVLPRFSWLVVAIAIGLCAAAFFDRFDPAKQRMKSRKKSKREADLVAPSHEVLRTAYVLRPVQPGEPRLLGILYGELLLLTRGVSKWWYLVMLGLIIACLFAPYEAVNKFLLPIAWIWPMSLWSSLSTRERQHGMEPIVGSFPSPLRHQLPALWIAGAMLGLLASSGFIIRAIVTGNYAAIGSLLLACLFVPGLALLFGSLSSSPRLFETIYLLIWYMGPVNQLPAMDYLGTVPESQAVVPIVLFLVSLVSIPAIVAARARQLRV